MAADDHVRSGARVIPRGRLSIVHMHNQKPSLVGQLAARLAGVPPVMNTVHSI